MRMMNYTALFILQNKSNIWNSFYKPIVSRVANCSGMAGIVPELESLTRIPDEC